MNIQLMCLAYGVSKSGYYAWLKRRDSSGKIRNAKLATLIKRVHDKSHGVYGSPRIAVVLNRQGIKVSENRVARIMQSYGIIGRVHTKKQRAPALYDVIKRTGNKRLTSPLPSGINQVWVGDVTYIRFQKRWWYLAVVMDVSSRKIVGWSLESRRRKELTMAALRQALQKRKPAPTDAIPLR